MVSPDDGAMKNLLDQHVGDNLSTTGVNSVIITPPRFTPLVSKEIIFVLRGTFVVAKSDCKQATSSASHQKGSYESDKREFTDDISSSKLNKH